MTSGKDLPFSENNNWAFSFRGICVEYGEDVWAPGLGAQEVVHEMRGTLLCNSFTFYTWKPTTLSTIFLIQNEKEMKS